MADPQLLEEVAIAVLKARALRAESQRLRAEIRSRQDKRDGPKPPLLRLIRTDLLQE